MSKGSRPRTYGRKYRKEYDRIFRKKDRRKKLKNKPCSGG